MAGVPGRSPAVCAVLSRGDMAVDRNLSVWLNLAEPPPVPWACHNAWHQGGQAAP